MVMSGYSYGNDPTWCALARLGLVIALAGPAGCERSVGPSDASSSTQRAPDLDADGVTARPAPLTVANDDLPIRGPSEEEPVVVAASLFPRQAKPGNTATLVIRVRMAVGWSISPVGNDGPRGPSLPTTLALRLPSGVAIEDDWLLPDPEACFDRIGQHLGYHGEVVFRRTLKVAANQPAGPLQIPCTVTYQACDAIKCIRPRPVELQPMLEVVEP